jgi:hypothetical protein
MPNLVIIEKKEDYSAVSDMKVRNAELFIWLSPFSLGNRDPVGWYTKTILFVVLIHYSPFSCGWEKPYNISLILLFVLHLGTSLLTLT